MVFTNARIGLKLAIGPAMRLKIFIFPSGFSIHLNGLRLLIDPNATINPNGIEHAKVIMNIRQVTPNPSSNFVVTYVKLIITPVQHNKAGGISLLP